MVLLSDKAYRLITEHVNGAYPHEACGVLLGSADGTRIDHISQAENAVKSGNADERFYIDPVWLYGIERESEKDGRQVLGFYHSHPDRPAVLSNEDKDHMIPGMIYLIASVTGRECKDLKGYKKESADGSARATKIVREAALN
ncbi:MAG: M67 family metallopeptidase [Lachnospiraceae bacterium]|nr:M67 family metallopeptidase [Lachnospiraceae bacterium]MBR5766906.1 M67 family metallopeptidase [Lachnospiraceae bacterium]MBR6485590.1 M67 family metallopeptidase [Lachnospiraceae bacterium]